MARKRQVGRVKRGKSGACLWKYGRRYSRNAAQILAVIITEIQILYAKQRAPLLIVKHILIFYDQPLDLSIFH